MPSHVIFRGERLSMHAVEKRLKVHWKTLQSWARHGGVSERRIARFLREREERRRLRALAREHGVPLYLLRHRLNVLGWPGNEAATTPAHGRRSQTSTAILQ